MRKIFLLLCFWTIICQYAIAQNSRPFSIPSPNATDLGRYGDIPVSPYTGQPNISIPLYDFTIRGVRLPVTLNYQATGVMMNSLPGWTGHNWVLSAGGCITRLANGRHDEYIYPETYNEGLYTRSRNYFNSYDILQPSKFISNNEADYKWLKDTVMYRGNDLEADIFSFNFMGLSGKFFLGNDGEWKVCSDANIEVIFDIEDPNNYIAPFFNKFPNPDYQSYSVPKVIKGFTLRDDNGTQYVFGGSQDCIEYSISLFGMSDLERHTSWLADTWYLKTVKDRHGYTLYNFSYARGKFITHIYNCWESIYYTESGNYFGLHNASNEYRSNSEFPYNAKVISPVYLQGIGMADYEHLHFESEDINKPMYEYYSLPSNFYYNVNRIIGSHRVYPCYYLQSDDPLYTPYQYDSQNHDKYYNPLSTSCLRKLTRIESYSQNIQGLSYYFTYNMSPRMHMTNIVLYGGDEDVPSYPSGHNRYSFTYNKFAYLPADYLTKSTDPWGYYTDHTDKTPSDTCTNYGMLTQIIYPTAGMTTFRYELNDYSSVQSDDRQSMTNTSGVAGGMRIKSITDYEDISKSKLHRHRDYRYKMPGTTTSSGELFAMPRHSWQWYPKTMVSETYVYFRLSREASVIPLSNSFGPHIGYSYVEEIDRDGNIKRYHYTNISSAKDLPFIRHFSYSLPTPFDKFGERGYRRGKLLDLSIIDNGTLTQKTEYTYRTDDVEQNYVLSSNLLGMNLGSVSASFYFYSGGVYKLFYPKYDVIQVKTTNYYPTGNIVDIRNYNKKDTLLTISHGDYQNRVTVRKLMTESHTRGSDVMTTTYTYPFQLPGGVTNPMAKSQFFFPVVATENRLNGVLTHKSETIYRNIQDMLLPKYEMEWNTGAVADTVITYNAYTETGAVWKYKELGKPETELFWTNNDNQIEEIRVGGHTTMCEYYGHLPLIITQPNDNYTEYEYDGRLRLSKIYDRDGNTIQRFIYSYRNH